MAFDRHPDHSPSISLQELGQRQCIAPARLDPISGLSGDQRWRGHRAGMTGPGKPLAKGRLTALPIEPAMKIDGVVQNAAFSDLLAFGDELEPLETIIIVREGESRAERGYRGHSPSAPTNIKSGSKPVIATSVGIAIEPGVLSEVEQRIAPLLRTDIPADADPRIEEITIGHLLSMKAGLRPTSGAVYRQWDAGGNWVARRDRPAFRGRSKWPNALFDRIDASSFGGPHGGDRSIQPRECARLAWRDRGVLEAPFACRLI